MAAPPTLSILLRNFSADEPSSWTPLLDRARAADVAGIDRVVVSDHVVFGEDLDAYGDPGSGGRTGGRQPTGPDGHWLEPLTVLSVVAGMTERVRLGTSILIAALRRPVVLAKTAATLDVLSGGRLDLGVGVGWQRAEYAAAGLAFDGRGRLLDDSLEVCRRLWTEPVTGYDTDLGPVEGIHQMPKPRQPGGVPLWISGRSTNRLVVERIVRYGSGWIPWGDDDADPVPGLARIRAAMADAGRGDDPLLVGGTLPVVRAADGTVDLEATMAGVPAMVAAGVTDFRANVPVPDSAAGATEALAEVVEAFRATTR